MVNHRQHAKTCPCNFHDSISPKLSPEIDRIDIRPEKGIAKFICKKAYRGIQVDATTGALLLIEKRHSDLMEDIHDGSILDSVFGTDGEEIKSSYTAIMGLSLFLLVISGVVMVRPKDHSPGQAFNSRLTIIIKYFFSDFTQRKQQ